MADILRVRDVIRPEQEIHVVCDGVLPPLKEIPR